MMGNNRQLTATSMDTSCSWQAKAVRISHIIIQDQSQRNMRRNTDQLFVETNNEKVQPITRKKGRQPMKKAPAIFLHLRLLCLIICVLGGQAALAQSGFLYIHTKTISEDLNQSFTFSVSGGPTSVANFTLLDQLNNTEPTDIGAGHGTGKGELWVVTGATQGADGSVYHRAEGSTIWNLVSGGTGMAIDGADLGHFVMVNATGDAYVYNGSTFFKIFNHSTYSVKAVDIANNGSITSGVGYTVILDANGHVRKYTGNYTSTTTWTDITPTDNSGMTFKRLDVNPTTNDIVLIDAGGYVTKVNSSGGALVYYGRTASAPGQQGDVTVDDNGTMYSLQKDSQGMDAAYRYNGTTWIEEPETGLHYFMTCSDAGQAWIIKGYTAAQSSSYANQSTIYTRVGDGSGTWLDDERVVTTQNDDAIMIPVQAGTYTITETNPSASWNLQKINIYDSTAGSSANVVGNSATVVVSAGQVVHVLFTNGLVAPLAIPATCGTANTIQNFGSGAANTRGGPLVGLTNFHYYSNATLNTTPDGYYSLTQNSSQWGNSTLTDHSGLSGGYFLMVNASYAPNEFYRQRVTGMAPGATYNFTFWAANLSPGSPLLPNILAGVTDTSNGAVLGSVSTGLLPTDNAWHQYTFSFKATVTTGDLFLQNNAPGGFGNDLAIDDISLTQTCSVVLAVNLTNFNAVKQGNHVLLSWMSPYNPDLDYFEVERSTDNGVTWHMIGMVMGTDNSGVQQDCLFKDTKPSSGTNLYRIVSQSKSGNNAFSTVKQVEMQGLGELTILLYPNPVRTENKLNVQLTGLDAGTYTITLISATGQKFRRTAYDINYSGSGLVVLPTNGMPSGSYVVMVSGNKQQFSKTIVIANQ